MQEVFKPNPLSVLTLRKINSLLVPEFSPVGSNKRTYETKVYTLFCKYMREVACKSATCYFFIHFLFPGAISRRPGARALIPLGYLHPGKRRAGRLQSSTVVNDRRRN